MKLNQLYKVTCKIIPPYQSDNTEDFFVYYTGMSYVFMPTDYIGPFDIILTAAPYYNLHKCRLGKTFERIVLPLYNIVDIKKINNYRHCYMYCLEGSVDDRVKFSIDSVINKEPFDFDFIAKKFGLIERKTIIEKL